ncbi:hypothetical protein ACFLZM_01890 [Thermodesulfobacteriota bacterium]
MPEQRKVAIVTTMGKKYSGMIDIPNASLRTTDLLNSSNIFWVNPTEKCYENAILMYDAQLMLNSTALYRKFDKIQMKIDEIVYFYDEEQSIGDEKEKKRASTMAANTQEKPRIINLITCSGSDSFYDITGSFYGLFRKKSHDKFLPLTEARAFEIYKKENKWVKKELTLPHSFIGVSNAHVESATMA